MKIIHTGDLHLGWTGAGLQREKAEIRKAEMLDAFRRLCAYAQSAGVDAVVIAGDLFDCKRVDGATVREVVHAIQCAPAVRFYCIFGNHDGAGELNGFQADNLYTFTSARGFYTYDLGDGVLLGGCDAVYFSAQSLPLFPRETFNICTLHGELGGDIPLASVRDRHIDYLALGHIHKPNTVKERLDARGYYRYCGCLEGRGFDELGARGCFLLEIVGGRLVDERFLSFARRTGHTVFVDISGCNDYFELERKVLLAVQSIVKEDMVKVVLTGTFSPLLRKDLPLLNNRLAERFFLVKVEDESKLFVDYKSFEKDLTERGEFVREVGRYEMDERLRAEILEVGLKALNGEEIDL